ncbi:MAG: GAF domain-containing protein, partial [Cyanobacteria bacterium J083]
SLIIPLLFQNQPLAMLAFHRCLAAKIWQKNEIELISQITETAGLAIFQALNYEKIKLTATREATINSVTATIRSSLEPERIFTAITKQLGEALKVDGCALSLWTKEDKYVHCVGLYDRSLSTQVTLETSLPNSVVPIRENPVLSLLLDTQRPVVMEDMNAQPELNIDLPLNAPARALLIVPLIFEGEIIGSISLRHNQKSRQWTSSDIKLVEEVASQAAIAVQQGQLYKKVKGLNEYLTESLLKRFLPLTMVKKAAKGELKLDLTPEPKLITILFSDIVNFTPLSAYLGARRIAKLLNEYLEAMSNAVFINGGTVDKFIGDAVVALFGAPEELSPELQVNKAIATAKKMHEYLEKLNSKWQTQGIFGDYPAQKLQFRCGIHQGKAVVGMFGSAERSDYTAIGPAVNLAARLQTAAQPNHILISQAVAQYLPVTAINPVKCQKLKGIAADFMVCSLNL